MLTASDINTVKAALAMRGMNFTQWAAGAGVKLTDVHNTLNGHAGEATAMKIEAALIKDGLLKPSAKREKKPFGGLALVSLRGVAEMLDVAQNTVMKWAMEGTAGFPKAIRIGEKLYRLDARAVENWVRQMAQKQGATIE